jgi:hypothetical protein
MSHPMPDAMSSDSVVAPDGTAIETELATAQQAVSEHAHQQARRRLAVEALRSAQTVLSAAREKVAAESADVECLETLSPTRIWAGLRGNRAERLDVERAERQAAEWAAASAHAKAMAAERELAVIDAAIGALGDVEARRTRALEAKEAWVYGGGGATAAELADIAQRLGAVRAELTEIDEAATAAGHAADALSAAAEHLRSADGWATYDTFMGGGMIADMVKHDKMDRAADLIRAADAQLAHLAVELGDLGERGVGGLGVDELTRTFDLWFDNIFSDWTVKNRIAEARERVDAAERAVDGVRSRLAARRRDAEASASAMAMRREELLMS